LDAVVLSNSLVADGAQVDGRKLTDVLVLGLQVRVEILESIGRLDDDRCLFSFVEDLEQLEDQN
jgi:hypothetical protein